MRNCHPLLTALAMLGALALPATGADDFNRTVLPIADPPFKGKIGLRPSDSVGEIESVTINLAEHKLTEEELQKYREGRLKAALSE